MAKKRAVRVHPFGMAKKYPNRVGFLILAYAIREANPIGNLELRL